MPETFDNIPLQSDDVPEIDIPDDIQSVWEEKLASEDLSDDVGEDVGRTAFEEEVTQDVVPEHEIRAEIQKYWVTRGAVKYGHHLLVAQELCQTHKLADGYLDELMEEVEDEIGQAQIEAFQTARTIARKNVIAARRPRMLKNLTLKTVASSLSHIESSVLDHIVEDAVNKIIRY